MIAQQTNLFRFLEGNKQFTIPLFQRTYSWQKAQCEQLWRDIIHTATHEDVKSHFVGSIVYVQNGIFRATGPAEMMVIDGQQRLTTLTLLLVALAQEIKKGTLDAIVNPDKIFDTYLTNRYESGEDVYKLILTQNDKHNLIDIIEGKESDKVISNRIRENYQYFVDQLHQKKYPAHVIYAGIGKLVLVDIALDRDHDDPQMIFESLNSTGLDLSQADLIRNYVLMRIDAKHQNRLYQDHWLPMEQLLQSDDHVPLFDRFVRDYLTMKSALGAIPRIADVYKSFKEYRTKIIPSPSVDELVVDLHRFAIYYGYFEREKATDPEIKEILGNIKQLDASVAYPMLLKVFADYEDMLIKREDVVVLLHLVETYVFRRAICGIPTNSMNKTFATIMRKIDPLHYRESVIAAFLRLGTYKRMPMDEEFAQSFVVKDVYNFQRRNYLLGKLENFQRKERVILANCTIEHIMPQNPNLSKQWHDDLGAEWQTLQLEYLHTIGNLTLTAYNSELSDRPFAEKRDMQNGLGNSPLNLNVGLGQVTCWNEAAIQQRANDLVKRALLVWAFPVVSREMLEQIKSTRALSDNQSEQDNLQRLDPHLSWINTEIKNIFLQLRKQILDLDAGVREALKKHYIAYKYDRNFTVIEIQQSKLKISLNISFAALNDPRQICIDSSTIGHSGNGTFNLASVEELPYALSLIQQSLNRQIDNEDDDIFTFMEAILPEGDEDNEAGNGTGPFSP